MNAPAKFQKLAVKVAVFFVFVTSVPFSGSLKFHDSIYLFDYFSITSRAGWLIGITTLLPFYVWLITSSIEGRYFFVICQSHYSNILRDQGVSSSQFTFCHVHTSGSCKPNRVMSGQVGVSESAHFGGRSGYLCPFFTQKSINPVEAPSPTKKILPQENNKMGDPGPTLI